MAMYHVTFDVIGMFPDFFQGEGGLASEYRQVWAFSVYYTHGHLDVWAAQGQSLAKPRLAHHIIDTRMSSK